MWKFPAICVYDWSLWHPMLIRNIVPTARYIAAEFDDRPQRVAALLPSRTRTLLVHLDISHNGPFIADAEEFIRVLTQHDIQVLNALPFDIRKRTIQACCKSYGLPALTAASAGPDSELLIVKSDLNCGGEREQRLSPERKARFHLPESFGRIKGPDGYFVTHRAGLSPEIWEDPDLVIEQYITNAFGRFYRVYAAVDAVVISEAYTDAPVKRMEGKLRRHNHWLWRDGDVIRAYSGEPPKLPPDLLRTAGVFLDRFQLHFGAVDIVESDSGQFYVVDVNKTPNWDDEKQPGLLEHLRLGFLQGTRPMTALQALSVGMKQKLKAFASPILYS
jgi:hypothetical protein